MGFTVKDRAKFSIAYEGKAVEDGAMNVQDLAPALMAIGQLFDAANTVINGQDSPKISVNVVATNSACFEVDLVAIQSVLEATRSFLVGDDVNAALNLFGLIAAGTGTTGGLIWLIKKLKGDSPDKVESLSGGMVQITHDGEMYTVPIELLRLYRDVAVRRAIEELVESPLSEDGISEFKIIDAQKNVTENVTKADASYFIAPAPTDLVLLKQNLRSAFSIVSLAFKEDNKWRLYDGNNQISALIEDEEFLRKVDASQVRFAKGDVLICDVTIEQVQTSSGLKTNYTVNKVVEHKPALRQLDIFSEQEKEENNEPKPS